MINSLNRSFSLNRLTIKQVLLAGLLFRLIAVIYSKGYAFHDDHFEMAELVQRWRDGYSFLWTGSDVHVFSLVYPGFLYLVFEACHAIGLHHPEQILFVTRCIHALFSLLSIWYSYKLVLRLTGEKLPAIIAALCMSLLWIFPFMSVRNLREMVCIPFMLAGCYFIADPKLASRSLLLAAVFFALAFTVRLQVLFIPLGIGLYLLFQKEHIRKAFLFGIFFLGAFMMTQGMFDLLYYGNPFASILEYLRFNSEPSNIAIQPSGPWYVYIGTIAGIFLGPPFLVLCFGILKSWNLKPARMFIAGSLLFFAFHSFYTNKQERFILPLLPFFIILGIAGLYVYHKTNRERSWKQIVRFTALWFVIANTAALLVLCFTYSKKSRVESMLYLREKGDVTNIIIESPGEAPRPPLFYLGKQINFYTLTAADSLPKLTLYIPGGPSPEPNYIIMSGASQHEQRLERVKKRYPALLYEAEFSPGFIDNIAYWLNPRHNDNDTWYIYKIK